MNEDQQLDRLLRSHPLTSRDTFVEETMTRVRKETAQPALTTGEASSTEATEASLLRPLRLFFMLGALGAAAAISTAYFLWDVQHGETPITQTPTTVQEMQGIPQPERAPASFQTASEPLSLGEEQEWLAAENSLEPVEFLFEGDNIEFLYLLSADLDY